MSAWSDTRLVAGREIDEKLHSKPFLYSLLLFLVIIAASVLLPALLSDDGPERFDVAVVGGPAEQLAQGLRTEDVEVTARPVADQATADRAVRDEDVDAALAVEGDAVRLTALDEVPEELADAVSGTARLQGLSSALTDAGTPGSQVQRLLGPVSVDERLLDDRGVDSGTITLVGLAFGLVFFFVVYTFGFAIAQTVVQEKESRVVELLVAAVPIPVLLAGKVLGNSLLALGQLVLLVAVAIGGAALSGQGDLVAVIVANSPWFLLFFLLGFVMLSCLWAVAGSFANRTEDLQSTTAPLQVLVIAPFLASVYVTDGVAQVVLSFLPLSAPLVMPARLVAEDAQLWEAGVSALLVLITAVLLIAVGSRLYKASLLRTRGKTSLPEALRTARA